MILASIWSRVHYENWHYILTILAFAIFFGVFLTIVVRTIRMKRDKLNHLSNLPLESDEQSVKHHES